MDTLNLDVPTLFAGGRLCLDFINTLFQRRVVMVELLPDSDALRTWLRQAGTIHPKLSCPGDEIWNAGYGTNVLPRAIALRAALHDLTESVLLKTSPPLDAIEMVNGILRANPTYLQLEITAGRFEGSLAVPYSSDQWLTRIAEDAVDLLCHGDLSLLRQCECATCIRFFYDTTKNHKRRWCVEKCSSQTKAAAYYRRKKAKLTGNS